MRIERIGPLTARITGGVDREGGGDGVVVVLLHGFGAPGDDLVSLASALDVPNDVRFVFPEAPIAVDRVYGEARAWWMIDWPRIERAKAAGVYDELARFEPPGLAEARAAMIEFLDALERHLGVGGDKLVLGGFSQGANLSTDLALRTKRRLRGLVHLSGSVLCQPDWAAWMKDQPVPVFISHGRDDAVLPFALAERLRDLWAGAGKAAEWVVFEGGHEIPREVMVRLGTFLTRIS